MCMYDVLCTANLTFFLCSRLARFRWSSSANTQLPVVLEMAGNGMFPSNSGRRSCVGEKERKRTSDFFAVVSGTDNGTGWTSSSSRFLSKCRYTVISGGKGKRIDSLMFRCADVPRIILGRNLWGPGLLVHTTYDVRHTTSPWLSVYPVLESHGFCFSSVESISEPDVGFQELLN